MSPFLSAMLQTAKMKELQSVHFQNVQIIKGSASVMKEVLQTCSNMNSVTFKTVPINCNAKMFM